MTKDHAGGVPLDELRFINSHEHVYLCQDCGLSQEEVTDLANTSPSTNTDLSNPQEQRIAEYKQLLDELPEKREDWTTDKTPYLDGYNQALNACWALIEARIKELE